MSRARRRVLAVAVAVGALLGSLVPAGAAAADPPRATPWTATVHRGYGAWFDVYDWSLAHTGGRPSVGTATIDRLAAEGVRTLYIQTARTNRPEDVTDRALLERLIDRAHARGISVVGWYLPTLEDVDRDLRRFRAALTLDIDGFALDIESVDVEDVDERNRRLLDLSRRMRAIAGDRALAATILSPTALEEVVDPGYWPRFPLRELGQLYDVIQPMVYFTYRDDGERYRDAERYVTANVERIRDAAGPDTLVHVIGGIANRTTVGDIRGMTRAAHATGTMGLSLYDVDTTHDALWAAMRTWRDVHEPGGTHFVDVDTGSVFAPAIDEIARTGVTRGCNPPRNDLFCPSRSITREEMAAFLTRALDLAPARERFVDVASDDTFAADIGALAAAGITLGCNPPRNDRFCPDAAVTRVQMASFLARGLDLERRPPSFRDVPSSMTGARDVGALQAARITLGCNPPANDRYCPSAAVSREQMAAFLARALSP